MWANTYLAAGVVLGLVIYTGKETRSMLNSKDPRSKMCLVDMELNKLTKICLIFMCGLAGMVIIFKGFGYNWIIEYFRFVLLLSSIIPISLRVNLDIAKIIYAYNINNDEDMPYSITRNSMIPEELGRV
jgi:phospholipid-translocating ATPase